MADSAAEITKTTEVTKMSPPAGKSLEPIVDRSANDQFTKSANEAAANGQSSLPAVEVVRKPLTGGIEKNEKSTSSAQIEKETSDSKKAGSEAGNAELEAMQARPDTFCQDVQTNLFKGEIMTICGEMPNKYKALIRLSEFFYAFDQDHEQQRIKTYKQMMHSGLPTGVNPATEWYAPSGNSLEPIWLYLYKTLPGSMQRRFEHMAAKHHLPITEEPIKLEK